MFIIKRKDTFWWQIGNGSAYIEGFLIRVRPCQAKICNKDTRIWPWVTKKNVFRLLK